MIAEVGDFVMFEDECREVARKLQLYENGPDVLVLKPGKYSDDIWLGVLATSASWPSLLDMEQLD